MLLNMYDRRVVHMDYIEYRDMVKAISMEIRRPLSEKLSDVLLDAKEGKNVPSSICKHILYYWERDELHSEPGLMNLLKAVELADPEEATIVLEGFNLSEIKRAISPDN